MVNDHIAALEANLDKAAWAVLETVHRFGFVSGPQLAQLHFGPGKSDGRAARSRAPSRCSPRRLTS